MGTFHHSFDLKTKAEGEIVDITGRVRDAIAESGLREGIACIFTRSSTSAIATMEYEPGLQKDLPAALERLFPRDLPYAHEETWHDGNGHSHVRASFLGPGLTIPFREGELLLGTWQQLVFMEFDVRPRQRTVIVEAVGE